MTLISITSALLAVYSLLILHYRNGWSKTRLFENQPGSVPHTKVSVIIPARNEVSNISNCIESIIRQDYPADLMEIILVDDHSTDGTADVAGKYSATGLKVVRLQGESDADGKVNGGKKKALSTGVSMSTGSLIITTDADCSFPMKWVRTLVGFYESQGPVFIAAPVMFSRESSALDVFQTLDFLSLQGITAASVSMGFHGMSNGANLAFEKKAFDTVDGYRGIDHIASGDDMLLMQKIESKYPGKCMYCLSKEAIVITKPADGLYSFFQQRIRWASKARYYKERKMLPVLLLVYLLNLFLLATFVLSLLQHALFSYLLLLILCKTVIESLFLAPVARFFGKSRLLWYFLPSQPFHILYTVMAGFFGQAGAYQWKGRKLK